ncbi:hypothetical protein GA0070616_5538 [Micromonospora nigra]|uniref:DUF5666 domain-containing protein n=1 Tax=Micromonospora nigra TaxID=145857 RepID=A0A1C6T514_9ACTN|nr:hypothetical protein [Micromonospora nigra]SCL36633.1 hypothetical protein GA0070616_5538 [Micromonospora nigra]
MRRMPVVLGVIGLLGLTAGCGDGSDPSSPGSPQPASPAPPLGSAAPTGPPGVPGQPPASPTRPASDPPPAGGTAAPLPGTTAFPRPSGGEVPGGLPWGGRTLTGTVERDGDCLMLLVGARRWALTGDAARGLTAGQRVTVQGSLTTRPATCGDRELAQTIAVTRVIPG